MNLNEACTAVSYELPVITVIFNNTVLGMVPPVADGVLRQAVFQYGPAPQNKLCKAGRRVWRERLSLRDAGCVFGGVCRSAEIERAGVD